MRKRNLGASLTIRLPAPLERRLASTSRARGETPSDLVRALIEAEVGEAPEVARPTALELLGDLVGSVSSAGLPAGRDAKEALSKLVIDRRG